MRSILGITAAICLCMVTAAAGQVVRFQTSVGDFDMVLNPTNNPALQGNVDNLLQYVEKERYKASWINRADTGFVLQMGGFYSHTTRPAPTMDSIRPFEAFTPVLGAPAAENGFSNTVGTVSMALSGLPTGGTNQNSGTSSFFVNLASNTFLDPDFTVFAAIPDMTVVNQIMALTTIDRTTDPVFGADPGNLAFEKVPLQDNGKQVFIKRAFVVTDAMSAAKSIAGVQSVLDQSAAAKLAADNLSGGGLGSDPSSGSQLASGAADMITGTAPAILTGVKTEQAGATATAAPEPTTMLLAAAAAGSLSFIAARRRRK